MKTKLIYLLTFVAGLGIGSAATYMLIKDKFDQLAQEEIDSVKETFKTRKSKENEHHTEEETLDKNDENTILKHDYTSHSFTESKEEKLINTDEPYVISPDEYGNYMDYDQFSLVYYNDGVLTDDNNIPIDDIKNTVGDDFADHFGEYEDDSVFIRNELRKCEYEILADTRNYSDVIEKLYK